MKLSKLLITLSDKEVHGYVDADIDGLAQDSRQPDGRPPYPPYSPVSRVGFSELFGGFFDGPLQLWLALLCHGGAPSPRPVR